MAWDYVGYCDACASSAGGVWLPLETRLAPVVWRFRFPPDIKRRCREGDRIANSDLEMAGVLLQPLVLEQIVPDLTHRNAAVYCDNTPAISWATKNSARSKIPGRLAHGLALRLQSRQMGRLQPISIAGDKNIMADVASQSFSSKSMFDFSDEQLLSHFASSFPPPRTSLGQL